MSFYETFCILFRILSCMVNFVCLIFVGRTFIGLFSANLDIGEKFGYGILITILIPVFIVTIYDNFYNISERLKKPNIDDYKVLIDDM